MRPYTENSRGLGLADMAEAIRTGRAHRANGDLAYHVLDIMLAVEKSIASGETVTVTSAPPEVAPLPEGWSPTTANA